MLEDDPVLGAVITNYPSDRGRLLILGGAVLGVTWIVVTLVLLPVQAEIAATVTVVIMALVTLAVGWYISHFWNREVVLYRRGFSYREGSYTAFIPYAEVKSLRQRAERMSYFGGLLRRTLYRLTLKTAQDETIVLTNIYKRTGELSVRLEEQIRPYLKTAAEAALSKGERVAFSATLELSAQGLHESGRDLPFSEYGGHRIHDRRLTLLAKPDAAWYSAPLADIDNITLLLDLLPKAEPPRNNRWSVL